MKRLFVFSIILAGAILTGSGLQAAIPAHKTGQDINVSSDRFVADLNGKSGTFVGNVLVTQGDIRMRADQVRITSVKGKADKVTATGHVVVDSPASGTLTGDRGVYSVGPRTVVMDGHVVLKREKDVMRGDQLTVNLETGKAMLAAGAGVQGKTPGRVQGVFTPTQDQR